MTLCQVPVTVMNALDGAFVENGQLTLSVLSPACMVVFAIVLVTIFIKRRCDQEEADEE